MLKSIGAFVCVRSREVVRFWEGPLIEAPLYLIQLFLVMLITYKALQQVYETWMQCHC